MKVVNLVFNAKVDDFPKCCPEGFQRVFATKWTRETGDGVKVSLLATQENVVITGLKGDPESAMVKATEACTSLGLSVNEMMLVNMVTHVDSGITNPHFSERSKLDHQKTEFCKMKIQQLEQQNDNDIQKIRELEERPLSRRNPESDRHRRSKKVARIKDQIARRTTRLVKTKRDLERREGMSMRKLILGNGCVMVFPNSGTWIFTGQQSMNEVHEDLAETTALVTPMPPIEDLKI